TPPPSSSLFPYTTLFRSRRDAEVSADSLGRLDAILVSHAHFDHLDLGSLRRLERKLPVVVPRGAGGLVRRRGFGRVVELDVGERSEEHTSELQSLAYLVC